MDCGFENYKQQEIFKFYDFDFKKIDNCIFICCYRNFCKTLTPNISRYLQLINKFKKAIIGCEMLAKYKYLDIIISIEQLKTKISSIKIVNYLF